MNLIVIRLIFYERLNQTLKLWSKKETNESNENLLVFEIKVKVIDHLLMKVKEIPDKSAKYAIPSGAVYSQPFLIGSENTGTLESIDTE